MDGKTKNRDLGITAELGRGAVILFVRYVKPKAVPACGESGCECNEQPKGERLKAAKCRELLSPSVGLRRQLPRTRRRLLARFTNSRIKQTTGTASRIHSLTISPAHPPSGGISHCGSNISLRIRAISPCVSRISSRASALPPTSSCYSRGSGCGTRAAARWAVSA